MACLEAIIKFATIMFPAVKCWDYEGKKHILLPPPVLNVELSYS
jgi:hypothetical protein